MWGKRLAACLAMTAAACGSPERNLVDTSGNVVAAPSTVVPRAMGRSTSRTIVRDDAFLQGTNIPASWDGDIAPQYTAQLYVPGGVSADVLSLMMVFGPDGANTSALTMYEPLADARAILVFAVDGFQPADDSDARSHEYYYCALKLASDLRAQGEVDANCPILMAGFSGGAKMAMAVGEYGGTAFNGVIAAGCNEDFASYALQMLDNPSALAMPYVLVNATDDSLVASATPAVLASMEQSGFTNVSWISYTGGHNLPPLPTMLEAVDTIVP